MKLLDTNVFLRYIAEPKTSQDIAFNQLAAVFFERAARGEETFITTEAVIAEVLYVLTSRHLYAFSREDAYDSVTRLLTLSGCRIENPQDVLSALGTWRDTVSISFVEALCLTIARQRRLDLVTFDTALARAAGTQRWDLRSTGDAPNPTVEMP
jgi:predicted nucleic-acid-binding protein